MKLRLGSNCYTSEYVKLLWYGLLTDALDQVNAQLESLGP